MIQMSIIAEDVPIVWDTIFGYDRNTIDLRQKNALYE